jgi:hypothetical protein
MNSPTENRRFRRLRTDEHGGLRVGIMISVLARDLVREAKQTTWLRVREKVKKSLRDT